MTSTNFNIGLRDTRNSSRVLKPPGGGHSDIFGVHEPAPAATACPKVDKRNASSIMEGTNAAGPLNASPAQIKAADSAGEKTESKPAPSVAEAAPAPEAARSRVPPGGFSSGLW